MSNPARSLAVDGSGRRSELALDSNFRWLLRWLDRHRWWVFAGILVVYALGFNGQWRMAMDSVEHAVVARHLVEGAGFTDMHDRTVPLQPGLPTLIAASFWLFGPDTFWPALTVLWLMGLGVIALTYRLFSLHASRGTAVAITVLVAVNEMVYIHSFHLLTDIPFLFGVMLFLVGYELHEQGRLAGWTRLFNALLMGGGLAMMGSFRVVVLTFFVALMLLVLWRIIRGPNRWHYAAVAAVAAFAVGLARWLDPRYSHLSELRPEEHYALVRLAEIGLTLSEVWEVRLWQFLGDAVCSAVLNLKIGVEGVLLAVPILFLGLALARRRVLWGLLVLAFSAQIVAFVTVPRYLLPLIPLFAAGWWCGAVWVRARLSDPWGGPAFIFMLLLWMVPNAIGVAGHIYEQRQVPFAEHYPQGTGRIAVARDFAVPVREHTDEKDLILYAAHRASVLEYLARRPMFRAEVTAQHWETQLRFLQSADRYFMITPDELEMDAFFHRTGLRLGPMLAETSEPVRGEPWRLHQVLAPVIEPGPWQVTYERLLLEEPKPETTAEWMGRLRGRETFVPHATAMLLTTEAFSRDVAPVLGVYDMLLGTWPSHDALREAVELGRRSPEGLTAVVREMVEQEAFVKRHGSIMTVADDEAFVRWLMSLERLETDEEMFESARERLEEGSVTRMALLVGHLSVKQSNYKMWGRTRIAMLYLGLLDRSPTPEELARWYEALVPRGRLIDVAGALLADEACVIPWEWGP